MARASLDMGERTFPLGLVPGLSSDAASSFMGTNQDALHTAIVQKLLTPAPSFVWKLYFVLCLGLTTYGLWLGWDVNGLSGWPDVLTVITVTVRLVALFGLLGYAWALRVPGSARVWGLVGVGLAVVLVMDAALTGVRMYRAALLIHAALAVAEIPLAYKVATLVFATLPALVFAAIGVPNVIALRRYKRALLGTPPADGKRSDLGQQ